MQQAAAAGFIKDHQQHKTPTEQHRITKKKKKTQTHISYTNEIEWNTSIARH